MIPACWQDRPPVARSARYPEQRLIEVATARYSVPGNSSAARMIVRRRFAQARYCPDATWRRTPLLRLRKGARTIPARTLRAERDAPLRLDAPAAPDQTSPSRRGDRDISCWPCPCPPRRVSLCGRRSRHHLRCRERPVLPRNRSHYPLRRGSPIPCAALA